MKKNDFQIVWSSDTYRNIYGESERVVVFASEGIRTFDDGYSYHYNYVVETLVNNEQPYLRSLINGYDKLEEAIQDASNTAWLSEREALHPEEF